MFVFERLIMTESSSKQSAVEVKIHNLVFVFLPLWLIYPPVMTHRGDLQTLTGKPPRCHLVIFMTDA
jgi:hypothetical protein